MCVCVCVCVYTCTYVRTYKRVPALQSIPLLYITSLYTALHYIMLHYIVYRDNSVGIATRYGLDDPGIEARCERDFPHLSRPAQGGHPSLVYNG